MKKQVYTVTITEINKCKVDIEASSKEEAISLIEHDYFNHANDYVLEPEDTFFE